MCARSASSTVTPDDNALNKDDWNAAKRILDAGNEDYTADEIVRRLALRGYKLVKLREDDHAYLAGLLRDGERF